MRIVSPETLSLFRGLRRCEVCREPVQSTDPHHVIPKGMGAGSQMDIPENLLAVCRFPCHNRCQRYEVMQLEQFEIVAKREGWESGERLREFVWAVQRAPKGTDVEALRMEWKR